MSDDFTALAKNVLHEIDGASSRQDQIRILTDCFSRIHVASKPIGLTRFTDVRDSSCECEWKTQSSSTDETSTDNKTWTLREIMTALETHTPNK